VWGAPLLVGAVVVACSSGATGTTTSTTSSTSSAATRPTATTSALHDVEVKAADFPALKRMTPVRGFFVANLLGDLDVTLQIARSPDGGRYPPGTLVHLVPQEAMVKHRAGFNPATSDWEFFSLDVSPQGTKIVTRGVEDVVNRFGGNCAACHRAADAKFDFVCEHDHGCAALPVGDDVLRAVQRSGPRP
jgi:mono/diheme cytochrome c family protein